MARASDEDEDEAAGAHATDEIPTGRGRTGATDRSDGGRAGWRVGGHERGEQTDTSTWVEETTEDEIRREEAPAACIDLLTIVSAGGNRKIKAKSCSMFCGHGQEILLELSEPRRSEHDDHHVQSAVASLS